LKKHGIVVVGRKDATDDVKKIVENLPNIYVIEGCEKDISSTMMRQKLVKGEDVTDLTFPEVVKYLEDHKLTSNIHKTKTRKLFGGIFSKSKKK
jgi:nicotinic acid mononucleotide adenylyltransferase